MRVLVTGHGADRDAVNAARRLVAYERLVVLTPVPDAPDLRELRENEDLVGIPVDVHAVPPADLLACLTTADAALDAHARDACRVHVAGGPNLVTSALLLSAFHHGVESFYCHPRGVSRLPVTRPVDLGGFFAPEEEAVLRALPDAGAAPLHALASRDVGLDAVKRALVRLRARGLVDATPHEAALTRTGAYYRAHLARSID